MLSSSSTTLHSPSNGNPNLHSSAICMNLHDHMHVQKKFLSNSAQPSTASKIYYPERGVYLRSRCHDSVKTQTCMRDLTYPSKALHNRSQRCSTLFHSPCGLCSQNRNHSPRAHVAPPFTLRSLGKLLQPHSMSWRWDVNTTARTADRTTPSQWVLPDHACVGCGALQLRFEGCEGHLRGAFAMVPAPLWDGYSGPGTHGRKPMWTPFMAVGALGSACGRVCPFQCMC